MAGRVPMVRWLPLRPAGLRADILAGIVVGLVVVPQALAYAGLAGLPPQHGLWAALLPCAVAAILGWSHHLHTGPVAMSAMLCAAVLSPLATPASPRWIGLMLVLCLLVGLIRLVAGWLRAAALADLVSGPVLAGFTSAAALIIGASQIDALCGIPDAAAPIMLVSLWRELAQLPAAHAPSLAMGLGCLAAMLALRRVAPRLPAVLAVMSAAGLASWLLGYAGAGGRVVGAIPAGLPPLTWPALDWHDLATLLPGAAMVALIGFMEVLSVAKTCAARSGQSIDLDRELIGQGAAALAAAATGGMPVSGSLSRSSLALAAGARSGIFALVSALVVLAALVWAGPVLAQLPLAALAAAVIASVLPLIDLGALRRAWRAQPHDGIAGVLTFAATLALAPRMLDGFIAGAVLAIGLLLLRVMRPRVAVLGRHVDGTWRDAARHGLALGDELAVLRFDGSLHFGSVSVLERAILDLRAATPRLRAILLSCEAVSDIDASACEALRLLAADLASAGVVLALAGVKVPVEETMARSGMLAALGPRRSFRSIDNAVPALAHELGLAGLPPPPDAPCPAI